MYKEESFIKSVCRSIFFSKGLGWIISDYTLSYPFGRRISKTLEKDDFTLSLLKEPNYPQITYYLYDEQNNIDEYD